MTARVVKMWSAVQVGSVSVGSSVMNGFSRIMSLSYVLGFDSFQVPYYSPFMTTSNFIRRCIISVVELWSSNRLRIIVILCVNIL
jgi:hypothetical protein